VAAKTKRLSWAAVEIADDVGSADAGQIARRVGGLVANDDRVRQAVQAALERDGGAAEIIKVIATALTR
jgi:hypothetical protein